MSDSNHQHSHLHTSGAPTIPFNICQFALLSVVLTGKLSCARPWPLKITLVLGYVRFVILTYHNYAKCLYQLYVLKMSERSQNTQSLLLLISFKEGFKL